MCNSLQQQLLKVIETGSKADRAIANYILVQLNNIPFETASSLARKVSVSEPTVGRFCRSLGYKGFKGLKDPPEAGHRRQALADQRSSEGLPGTRKSR